MKSAQKLPLPNPGLALWQRIVKRLFDLIISSISLIITFPACVILAIVTKLSGRGPVLFSQERIGLHGKPFIMYKFRTMHVMAEPDGPMLSSPDDPRVTRIGRFMRQHKLDEIPNFINVIKGEMSIVGPRPEREFYILQLKRINPEIDHIFTVKPGITSYGQVLIGYASNISEMTKRLTIELEYARNPSLKKDFFILGRTILLLLRGRKD
jgi:lipopolysaccharide/colanic/teichoic acid biosynthesis glycosyltransferase